MNATRVLLACSLVGNLVAIAFLARQPSRMVEAAPAPVRAARPFAPGTSPSSARADAQVAPGLLKRPTVGASGTTAALDGGSLGPVLDGSQAGWLAASMRIAGAPAGALPGLLAELAQLGPSQQRADLLAQLYRRWGEVDPREAFGAIAGLPLAERQAREMDVIRGWAMEDPVAALAWMDRNPPPLTSTSTTPLNATRYNVLADALLAADRPDLLSAAFGSAPDDAHRSLLAVKLADYMARYNPSDGVTWLLELPQGAVRNNAAARFARTMAEDSPELALELATNLPNNAGRGAAITSVFKQWADSGDPAAAAAWLAQQKPAPAIDNALIAFLPVTAAKDADVAARLLGRFSNPESRTRAIDAAATSIAKLDPARALDWSLSYSPPTEDRVKKLQPLVNAWLKADPAGAAERLPTLGGLTMQERETFLALIKPPAKKK